MFLEIGLEIHVLICSLPRWRKLQKNVLYSWQLNIASKYIWTKDVNSLDIKVFMKIQMEVILEVDVFQKPEV